MAEQNALSTPELSPLEQDVLDEYERLANNMKQVRVPRRQMSRNKQRRISDASTTAEICFLWLTNLCDFFFLQLATLLDTLASNPTTDILDGLRELERKTSLAFTLLKASVYSIVLQQEIDWGGGAGGGEEGHAQGEHEED